MSDLRAPVARALEHLAVDVVVERYGDPHAAFVVFVYPDREPEVVGCSPRKGGQAGPLADLRWAADSDDEPTGDRRMWTAADLDEATTALRQADMAVRIGRGRGPGSDTQELGERVVEWVRQAWARSREFSMDRALERAAYEAARPAVCPACKQRFTPRGLAMHRSRTRSQRCRDAARVAVEDSP